MKKFLRIVAVALVGVGLAVTAEWSLGVAQNLTAEQAIKQRESVMEAVGDQAKKISKLDLAAPESVDTVLAAIPVLLRGAGTAYTDLFPEGSQSKGAKPEIWTNRAEFESKSKAFEKNVRNLESFLLAAKESGTPVDVEQFKVLVKVMGDDCTSCHTGFKVKD